MKKLIILFALITIVFTVEAQTISITNTPGQDGTNISVPIMANNVQNLGALTLFISYDTTKLVFDTIANINSSITGTMANEMGNEQVGIVWSALSNGVSFNGEKMFDLQFFYIGDTIELTFSQGCELADFNGQIMNSSYVSGTVYPASGATVSFTGLSPEYCQNDPASSLIGTPTNGIFSGNGIVGEQFIPADAGSGIHQIIYLWGDNFGNSWADTQYVEVYEIPQLSSSFTNPLCFGDSTGSISLSISAGTSPYNVTWNNGYSGPSLINLPANSYSAIISDANSCQISTQLTLIEPDVLEVTLSINHESAYLASDGSISAIVSGGTPAYNYSWSSGDTGSLADNLGVGNYFLTVTDANSCYIETTAEIKTLSSQNLLLNAGWSMFSLNILPEPSNLDSVFSNVLSSIFLAKDGNGNTYWPQYNINLIGDFTVGEGYLIKMVSAVALNTSGFYIIPENTLIELPQGWSMIGYLRTASAPIDQMLSSIQANILIVKDENGSTYWPLFGINGIGNMNPGKAYLIKMAQAVNYYFPAN